ncbi:hypothetical protein ACGFIY_33495 [Micromonospora chersina]|uniref:hypothetical protein n=1 Tax=Micromonospora chersina TaxID=47854 RepID=UPI003723FFF4
MADDTVVVWDEALLGYDKAARELQFCYRHEVDERVLLLAGENLDRRPDEFEHLATVAVARKLLTLVYYGLRDGRIRASYRPRRRREQVRT